MKKFIFEEFSNKLESESDIDNIINLIDCFERKNKKKEKEDNQNIGKNEKDKKREEIKNKFLKQLMGKNLFTKEEYFSTKKNLKIILLYKLYEKGIIQKNDE